MQTMTIRFFALAATLGLLFQQCSSRISERQNQTQSHLPSGNWRGVLEIQGKTLPFNMYFQTDRKNLSGALINGQDTLWLDDISISEDSIIIPLHIYDATIKAAIHTNRLSGTWSKNYLDNYIVPFEAYYGLNHRFDPARKSAAVDFSGKWEVDFGTEGEAKKAIGLFRQVGGDLTGTFLTPTGDYRFLAGQVAGDSMVMSAFDGVFAYLVEGIMQKDGTISGELWSGKTRHQPWRARKNPDFELPSPTSLTLLKTGYDQVEIDFPDETGKRINLNQKQFEGKVVVLQILGSWCPNCMDETKFLAEWYRKHAARGVEIIGLAFEKKDDFTYAAGRIARMKTKMNVPYPILIAGSTSIKSVQKALPMIDRVRSYPTTIYLDKEHRIRKIHTGFSGPGTGHYYEEFIDAFNQYINKLLEE
jgi:thiol-disulfide isomerase/thioredoxin